VPAKPTMFSVFADDHGNVYFNWSLVSGARGYTVYWCQHHVHAQKCAVRLIFSTFFDRLMLLLLMFVLQN